MKEIIKVFKALSDPTRLRTILLLLGRDLCVCELMFVLKMSQSRLSHQLRILRDAGLVEPRRDGKWIIYGIPQDVRDKLNPLMGLFLKDVATESEEIREDLGNLRVCLREDLRRTRQKRKRRSASR
jgi:ArsR family transcriptional regulator